MSTFKEKRTSLALWVSRLDVRTLPYTLMTAQELLEIFDPDETSRMNAQHMARQLSHCGYVRAAQGMPCTVDGAQIRPWIMKKTNEPCDTQRETIRVYKEERTK